MADFGLGAGVGAAERVDSGAGDSILPAASSLTLSAISFMVQLWRSLPCLLGAGVGLYSGLPPPDTLPVPPSLIRSIIL
ncbi:MAG: hypothetical protein H7A36_03050 [Chlamydiales bacterium]|nr:hypothetical protein [Chlamydiales bacterium]